jgi:phosphohistidine phosphatase
MNLYLLRHGDAIQAGNDDASRTLSSTGQEEIRLVASTLKRLEVSLDLIISSPLQRAQQTANMVRHELDAPEIIISNYLIPTSDHRQIIRQLNVFSISDVLLVGHEPHLSTFISVLISGSKTSRIEMKKGTLACIEIPFPIKPGSGILKWLLSVQQMKLLN